MNLSMKLPSQLRKKIRKLFNMQLNWNDIEKDMPLYLLVPFSDENNDIYYEYQESKVICAKPYTDKKGNVLFVNVRFKYTDQDGKRRRVNVQISDFNKVIQEHPNSGNQFGRIIISFENKEELRNKYNKMIANEIDRLNKEIAKLKEQTSKLEKKKYADF